MHRTQQKSCCKVGEKKEWGECREEKERMELIRNIDVLDRLLNFSAVGVCVCIVLVVVYVVL